MIIMWICQLTCTDGEMERNRENPIQISGPGNPLQWPYVLKYVTFPFVRFGIRSKAKGKDPSGTHMNATDYHGDEWLEHVEYMELLDLDADICCQIRLTDHDAKNGPEAFVLA